MTTAHYDCIVVGAGPVGLAAAVAIAQSGLTAALIVAAALPKSEAVARGEDNRAPRDVRTAALFPASVNLLRSLGAWDDVAAVSAPLLAIRLVDQTGGLLRAPEVVFRATEIGLPHLGFNVPQSALGPALAQAVRRAKVDVIEGTAVTAIEPGSASVSAVLSDGRRLEAALVIGADGRGSLARSAAGIGCETWSYRQAALVTSFRHTRAHHGTSTEIYGSAGPCTTVPLPGLASSLVWMERPDEVARLSALPEQDFLAALAERLGGMLGRLSDAGPRRTYAMSSLIAATMGQHRIALAGEAGHALPPIGAQGLNLGLSDVGVLADVLAGARARGQDIGAPGVLAAYDRARSGDVRRRIRAVDLLNTSVESGLLPLHLARGAGLHALAASPPLRRSLMLQGLYPPAPIPRLMRDGDEDGSHRIARA